ncbi:MAG TPA: HAD family phosphatase [Rhizobacter sp.]|nr:HAD family phosphatase [Rhizobacter sp.]
MRNLCLFDLDHTLLPIDSDHAWGEFMLREGWVDGVDFGLRNDAFYAQYQAGTLDIHEYIEFSTRPWRHKPPEELRSAHAKFMREVIRPVLRPAALDLVRQHLEKGDLTAIVTATNDFITAPIAEAFGVAHLLALRLEKGPTGNITGRIDGVPSFREGKTLRTEQWLADLGHRLKDFERISVYSDSTNDLPLMECATDAVATNPSPSLEMTARARGWRILQLFS